MKMFQKGKKGNRTKTMSSSALTAHTNKIEIKPIQRSKYLGSRFKKIEELMKLSEQDGDKAIP